jgi:hypothetical protein
MPSGKFDLGPEDPAADSDLDQPTLSNDDDDAPTGALELPPPRVHETRRMDSPPLDDDDDPQTPQEIIEAPPALAARQARPTPIAVKRHLNAPVPVNTKASTIPMPPVAQPNAPQVTLDEADTRERTRKAPSKAPTPPTFADDLPEPTVGARPQNAAPAQSARPPSQKVQPLAIPAPVPQVSSAAETLAMPPSHNPMAATARAAASPKPSVRLGFDEPTRIPPAQPPPLDSGRYIPGLEDGADSALSSLPLGEPDATLRPKNRGGVYVAIGILVIIALGAAATILFAGGAASDGRGTLTIVSFPPGAEVRVDGVGGAELTPLTLRDVDRRASHHLRVSKSGYDVYETDVKFPDGEREVRVQAVLVPAVGTVEISSTPPGAEVVVNGRIRGMTPTTVGDLPPNDDVQIELRLRGYKVAHKTVVWAGKRSQQVSIPLEKAK